MMSGRKILEPAELPIANLLVELRRLEAEGVHIDILCTATLGFLFGGLHQRLSQALAAIFVRNPQQPHEHPAKKRLRDDATDDLALLLQRDSQRPKVELANRLGIERSQSFQDLASGQTVHSFEFECRHDTAL